MEQQRIIGGDGFALRSASCCSAASSISSRTSNPPSRFMTLRLIEPVISPTRERSPSRRSSACSLADRAASRWRAVLNVKIVVPTSPTTRAREDEGDDGEGPRFRRTNFRPVARGLRSGLEGVPGGSAGRPRRARQRIAFCPILAERSQGIHSSSRRNVLGGVDGRLAGPGDVAGFGSLPRSS